MEALRGIQTRPPAPCPFPISSDSECWRKSKRIAGRFQLDKECRDNGATRSEMQMAFELCDLGWFPYYYKNVFDVFEGIVCKQDSEGRILSVRHSMKRKLKEIAQEWDAQLEDMECTTLSGNSQAENLFPPPFFLTLSPAP